MNRPLTLELKDEKGHNKMAQSVLDQMSEQIDETAHKASRAACAVGEALEDGVIAARRAAKHGSDAAVEFYDGTKKRMQQNPIETVVAATAIGIAIGATISWVLRQKRY